MDCSTKRQMRWRIDSITALALFIISGFYFRIWIAQSSYNPNLHIKKSDYFCFKHFLSTLVIQNKTWVLLSVSCFLLQKWYFWGISMILYFVFHLGTFSSGSMCLQVPISLPIFSMCSPKPLKVLGYDSIHRECMDRRRSQEPHHVQLQSIF